MKKIRFGIDLRRVLTGADLYVLIFQISSLLAVPYMIAASGHAAVMGTKNVLSLLFDTGMCAVPKAEALLLSLVYRLTASEIAVYFVMLAIALALGITAGKVLRGDPALAVKMHKTAAALICIDLVIRMIPLGFNVTFGIPTAATGFVIRAVCLVLLIADLRADKKQA